MQRVIDRNGLKAAADDVVAAALLGEDWDAPLTRFAHAAGARDAVLMRNTRDNMVVGVATEEAVETVAAFAAGRAPPNSRYAKVKLNFRRGFRFDHDDYSDDELACDPFYQEFLRPVGVFWHANVMLSSGPDEHVELSLKRRVAAAPYTRSDAAVLDGVLPDLRAAANITKALLDAEARGMGRLPRYRGETVVELDGQGRVIAGQAIGETDPSSPLRVVGRRLAATARAAQTRLDRAIEAVLSGPGRMTLAPLTGPDGRRYVLQIHPVPGRAREIFLSASAVAVLIERDRGPAAIRTDPGAVRDLFGLTDREADVACLLAGGLGLPAIAETLGISPDTARTYLKYAFEKIGVGRQAELVALIMRLRG